MRDDRADVRITIDAIVLDGVELSDPDAFRAALAESLADLAGDHQDQYPSGTASVLHGQPVTAPVSARDVARSVWHSMIPAAGGDA